MFVSMRIDDYLSRSQDRRKRSDWLFTNSDKAISQLFVYFVSFELFVYVSTFWLVEYTLNPFFWVRWKNVA